jgi:hypothetical protein
MAKSNNTNYFLQKTMNEILSKSFTPKIFLMNGNCSRCMKLVALTTGNMCDVM